MTMTHGSLCSGYDGIGLALKAALGAELAYVCDFDPAPQAVLRARYPDVTLFEDVKALEWAQVPVGILSAGYPCQPFSGAGKRLGTEDPRHLFPWIAKGIALSRPPLVLLENVRGHLSLGWDVVLIELHRLGYDVRWTLLRAADVGAPHGRARLFPALCADRDVHGWAASSRVPDRVIDGDGFSHPNDGLFGAVPVTENLPTAGLMVDGVVWAERPLLGEPLYDLLATPRSAASRTSRSAATRADSLSGPSLEQCIEIAQGQLPREFNDWAEAPASWSLLPEIEAARLAEPLFRTPTAQLAINGGSQHPDKRKEGGHGPTLADEVEHLLATPTCAIRTGTAPQDSKGKRDLRLDVDYLNALLPTPTARDHKGDNQRRDDTCLATDGTKGGPNQAGSSGDLMLPSAVMPSRWGRYAAAVARCEALTRPAPDPTAPTGKKGAQRLSPAFVEWMMMLPAGWVTDLGLKRDAQLKLLGNGVVPPQAQAAVRHLLGGLVARRVAA